MPNITMKYGAYNFAPVPLMSISKEYQRTADGTPVGTLFTVDLNGTLVNVPGGLSAIVAQQSGLISAFNQDGLLFEVLCDSGVLFSSYPIVNGPKFDTSSNNWVFTCPYNIQLQFDHNILDVSNSSIMPPYISEASENWSVEVVEDKAYNTWVLPGSITDTNPIQLRLSHSVSAVGKTHYHTSGTYVPAWQQARTYVVGQLGYNSNFANGSGVLNIDASAYSGFNHVRSNSIDELGGTFSVSESWVLMNPSLAGVAGNAIEDYTIESRQSATTDITTISIQGTIQGLENRSYGSGIGGFAINQTKFNAASGYWNTIKDTLRVYPRAQLLFNTLGLTRSVNVIPLSKTIGYNPNNGVINYSYEYDDRPSNCIANSKFESITISDTNPVDVFAEIPIPGRSNGPILQDMGTVTSRKREVSVEVIMAPATGCTAALLGLASSPATSVATLIGLFYTELVSAGYTQIFTYIDNNTWLPREGRYNKQVGWVYQSGCS